MRVGGRRGRAGAGSPGGGDDGGVEAAVAGDGHRQWDDPAGPTQNQVGKRLEEKKFSTSFSILRLQLEKKRTPPFYMETPSQLSVRLQGNVYSQSCISECHISSGSNRLWMS